METKSYFFRIDKKFFKQWYVLFDGNNNVVYEAKMTKFSLFTAFKFDGKNIWDYLHEQGLRFDSQISSGSIGMTYTLSLQGKEIATLTMANPSGKKLIVVSDFCYDINTTEEYLDFAFLAAFALARTEQIFYN